jgi:hypothetical protein
MRRQARNYIAMACFALLIVGFPSNLWLFFKYQSIRPSYPRPELGFVHFLNNHGAGVYVSDAESTGLALLDWIALTGLLLFLIVVPKKYTPNAWFEHNLVNPTKRQYRVLWTAMACYLSIIIFAGHRIVAFVVSYGIVLSD